MLLFARSPRRQVGDARIYFFTAYTLSFRALVEKSPAKETERHEPAPAHLPVAARHLAAVPGPATRKKVDSIIRVTLSRDFRVVWENSVGTDALVRPQRDSAAGKNSFGISIPASVGRDALVPPTINRTPLSFRAKSRNPLQ